ncbi:PEP-CTERM sorting domain-containing protein [Candidatus Poribacteria bacterium]|nr:PEP-CTERM sorting domain-containing protein [Candidatus Poribacteria bacterium]
MQNEKETNQKMQIQFYSSGLSVAMVLLLTQSAGAVLIDFEGLADSTPVTNQFSGVIFSNATVLTAGISLNEFEFPPVSGVNVVFDDGGPIGGTFSTPALDISGFFTYTVPLTLTAFDSVGNMVASATSAFTSNLALSGDFGSSPNELLSVSYAGGISSFTISGDPFGVSFTLDDFAFTPTSTPIPEPSSLLLVFAGLLAIVGAIGLRRRKGASTARRKSLTSPRSPRGRREGHAPPRPRGGRVGVEGSKLPPLCTKRSTDAFPHDGLEPAAVPACSGSFHSRDAWRFSSDDSCRPGNSANRHQPDYHRSHRSPRHLYERQPAAA